jgi:hypothetical protein
LDTEGRGREAPFDEPALWIVGEWRQGSGPSSHLALCLGEIMVRVGQRYLAWTCYERAARMANLFSPRPAEQQFLREHCKARQAAIEKSLQAKEVADLRPRFETELAFGEAYQRDFQTFEEQKIRAGADLNNEHFYDDFHAGRPPIASKVGPEEWYAAKRMSYGMQSKLHAFWSWSLLVAGACVLLGALIAWARHKPARLRVTEFNPPPSPAA